MAKGAWFVVGSTSGCVKVPFEEVGREGVAERMGRDPLANPGALRGSADRRTPGLTGPSYSACSLKRSLKFLSTTDIHMWWINPPPRQVNRHR